MGGMLSTKGLLLVKTEGTFGTDAAPVEGTDAILIGNPQVSVDPSLIERDNLRPTISQQNAIMGKTPLTISFTWELRGSGAAGTAPSGAALLRACGYSETVDAGVSVTYAPISASFESVTCYLYYDGILIKGVGMRGTYTLDAPGGERGVLNVTLQGRLAETPSDVALPASPTYDTVVPPVVESCVLTMDGDSLIVASVNIDAGNQVEFQESVSAVDGIIGAIITSRAPTMSFDPEVELEATHPFWGNFTAGTEMPFSMKIGATAGNICTITAPKAQYTNLGSGDRTNIRTYDATARLNLNAGNDELVLTFT